MFPNPKFVQVGAAPVGHFRLLVSSRVFFVRKTFRRKLRLSKWLIAARDTVGDAMEAGPDMLLIM